MTVVGGRSSVPFFRISITRASDRSQPIVAPRGTGLRDAERILSRAIDDREFWSRECSKALAIDPPTPPPPPPPPPSPPRRVAAIAIATLLVLVGATLVLAGAR